MNFERHQSIIRPKIHASKVSTNGPKMSSNSASNSTTAEEAARAEMGRPTANADQTEAVIPTVLFVDLDGTLHTSDLFAECLIQVCQKTPRKIGNLAAAALKGRAALKRTTADLSFPDISTLP